MSDKDRQAAARLDALLKTSGVQQDWLTTFQTEQSGWDKYQQSELDLYQLSELYHENSKLRRYQIPALDKAGIKFDSDSAIAGGLASIGKSYPAAERYVLPPVELLNPDETPRGLNGVHHTGLERIGRALYRATDAEIRLRKVNTSAENRRQSLYSKLYPIEAYVGIMEKLSGLDAGIYHYNLFGHALEQLSTKEAVLSQLQQALTGNDRMKEMQECRWFLILSAIFSRTKARYGERGYRLALQESGKVLQSAQAEAVQMNCSVIPFPLFIDEEINQLIQVDGLNESVVAVCGFVNQTQ